MKNRIHPSWAFGLLCSVFIFSSGIFSSSLWADEEDTPALQVYRGVSHVHSQYSHDSNAPLGLILEKARTNDLDFVIVTDHNSMAGRNAYKPNRSHNRPLLIFGDEISTPAGHLIALGIDREPREGMGAQDLIDWIHGQGGYAILPHPFGPKNPWRDWTVRDWDGLELYNFGHGLFEGETVELYLRSFTESNSSLLKSSQKIPPEHFSFWDEQLSQRRVAGIAGCDAHLKREQKWFSIALESVTIYVIADQLEEKEIIRAIGTGRAFMVFEVRGKASGFSFWAERGGQIFNSGDTVQAFSEVNLHVHAPAPAKIRLIRDGTVMVEGETQDISFSSVEPGAYRVEVYLGEELWIFSNPVYLKA